MVVVTAEAGHCIARTKDFAITACVEQSELCLVVFSRWMESNEPGTAFWTLRKHALYKMYIR